MVKKLSQKYSIIQDTEVKRLNNETSATDECLVSAPDALRAAALPEPLQISCTAHTTVTQSSSEEFKGKKTTDDQQKKKSKKNKKQRKESETISTAAKPD